MDGWLYSTMASVTPTFHEISDSVDDVEGFRLCRSSSGHLDFGAESQSGHSHSGSGSGSNDAFSDSSFEGLCV